MATSNDKISAIKKLIALGYEVSFREAKPNNIMVISVIKNGKEVGFIMDTVLGADGLDKPIVGSALNIFVKKVDAGWPDKEAE